MIYISKVNYRRCDICGDILKKDIKIFGFTNGYRLLNRLFNKLDICNACVEKIKKLSIDVKEEEKYVNEFFDKHDRYENLDYESAYLQGAEDMLGVLSHRRLKDIKINKK